VAGSRRRGGGGRASRRRKNQTWVSTIVEAASFDNDPVIEATILNGANWSLEQGLDRATLMTIRGWLSVSYDPTQTVANRAFYMIYMTDVDTPILAAGTNGPADALAYIEDVIWTGGWQVPIGKAASVEQSTSINYEFNIKAMRRMTSDQVLRVAFAAGTAGSFFIASGLFRCLVRKGAG